VPETMKSSGRQFGYKNVFRDPLGYPEWKEKNCPWKQNRQD
jgi:hypothetical protein